MSSPKSQKHPDAKPYTDYEIPDGGDISRDQDSGETTILSIPSGHPLQRISDFRITHHPTTNVQPQLVISRYFEPNKPPSSPNPSPSHPVWLPTVIRYSSLPIFWPNYQAAVQPGVCVTLGTNSTWAVVQTCRWYCAVALARPAAPKPEVQTAIPQAVHSLPRKNPS